MALCKITKSTNSSESLIEIRIPFLRTEKNEKLPKTILVLDRSASMAGAPWRQIESAVEIIEKFSRNSANQPTIIVYNHESNFSDFQQIKKLLISGKTDFLKAFAKIQEKIIEFGVEERVVIIFMSDGSDSCNSSVDLERGVEMFSDFLKEKCRNSIVHSIGYSSRHDLKMLNKLRKVGATCGVYRYAEGSSGLEEKLGELFEFVERTIEAPIKFAKSGRSTRKLFELSDSFVEAEFWFDAPINQDETVELEMFGQTFRLETIFVEKNIFFELKLFLRRIENFSSAEKIENLLDEMENLSSKIYRISQVETRRSALEIRSEIKKNLEIRIRIESDAARASLNEISALASLKDLRFEKNFSKSSRQRRMNKRAIFNRTNFHQIDRKLDELRFDPNEDFRLVDLQTFFCFLTLKNVKEILVERSDDFLGFGLVVQREEHVVEAPTAISVKQLSVSFLSRNASDDAIAFRLTTRDAQLMQNAFSTPTSQDDQTISFFTRGVAAEPINAFLPLYICEAHFARVEVLIEPILGYFFTLDATGFRGNQYLGLYSILGQLLNIIGKDQSERHELIIEEFRRLCEKFLPALKSVLGDEKLPSENFFDTASGRSETKIPNLMTLFGLIFANKGEIIDASKRASILGEMIRRHFSQEFSGISEVFIEKHLEDLLHGKNETLEKNDFQFSCLARSIATNIELEDETSEREISAINDEIRSKIEQILGSFSTKNYQNVFHRLSIFPFDLNDENDLKIVRSVVVQSLRFRRNESMNSARLGENFFDAQKHFDLILERAQTFLRSKPIEKNRNFLAAQRIGATKDLSVFIGRLMFFLPTRNGILFDFLLDFLLDRTAPKVPLFEEKIVILFTGKSEQINVFHDGLAWRPDFTTWTRIQRALGRDGTEKLRRIMSGRTYGHIYRLSDIPNRHGFHRSNPNPKLVGRWDL